MVDKSWIEINSLNEVFPSSTVLLCWFHVTQVQDFSILIVRNFSHSSQNILLFYSSNICLPDIMKTIGRLLYSWRWPFRLNRFLGLWLNFQGHHQGIICNISKSGWWNLFKPVLLLPWRFSGVLKVTSCEWCKIFAWKISYMWQSLDEILSNLLFYVHELTTWVDNYAQLDQSVIL